MLDSSYVIEKNITVRDAFRIQDELFIRILFLVDKNKVVAAISDGDIRRFILQGGSLDEPALKAANEKFIFANDYESAYAILEKKANLKAIPVMDDQNGLIDIVVLEKRRYPQIDIPVVINAGGKGTRLDPYTKILPKPLIPVGDKPVLEIIMQEFNKYGCDRFFVITNYKRQLLKAYFSESKKKYNITWVDEDKPLGTGGGVKLLSKHMDDVFFFSNCDTLIQTDYKCIVDKHLEKNNLITVICAYKNFELPYGIVELQGDGKLAKFREKPEYSFLINTGLYVLGSKIFDYIHENEEIGFPEIIERARKNGERIGVYPISEKEWMDMGNVKELERMRKMLDYAKELG